MPMDKDSIRVALTRVPHPTLGADVVTAGAVSKIAYCDGYASIRVAGGGLHDDHRRGLMQQVSAAVRLHAQQAMEALADVHVEITEDEPELKSPVKGPSPSAPVQQAKPPNPLPNVRHVIAVGAGKGGVGKSTIAVNLAVGLARRGHAVGLMDGDIYGPSLPTMLGLGAMETIVRGKMIEPFFVHGVKAMTIGKLVDSERPLIWRGPMAHGAFKQLVEQTNWGELDYLVIDLPPGTGDVALTMAQVLRLTGAVVVCTPQRVAQDDAVRAVRMFQQLSIEVLGIVENMSYFVGDDGREYDLFGRGGAQMMAQRLGLPFLGAVPINMALRERSDSGEPVGNFTDGSDRNRPLAESLERLVSNLEGQVALAALRTGQATPTLTIR
ncbi:MAG: Mrp/NBP35 family ATP-binding protein [Phycisphaeraceae bacterium]|nr:Mrp/NBP35 family ATP-binding protein [Phycisphaeraceae bacterium]